MSDTINTTPPSSIRTDRLTDNPNYVAAMARMLRVQQDQENEKQARLASVRPQTAKFLHEFAQVIDHMRSLKNEEK